MFSSNTKLLKKRKGTT